MSWCIQIVYLPSSPSLHNLTQRVEKNKKEVEAAKERRRLSPSGPTLATTLKAKEAAAAKQGGGRR